MTEFSARKLGEVLAFAQVGIETMQRGAAALATVVEGGKEGVDALMAAEQQHADAIMALSQEAGMAEATTTKAAATGTKLRAMRDLYVADQWDNATELMEWSGFFEGAAVVHWALVQGAADGMGSQPMRELANKARAFHQSILDNSIMKIIGYAKGKETPATA